MNTSMKLMLLAGISGVLFYLIGSDHTNTEKTNTLFPFPFETEIDFDDPQGNMINYRMKWEDRIHSSAPNQYWKTIEKKNKAILLRQKEALKASMDYRASNEDIGDGRLIGNWSENGSTSLAGSVIASTYDEQRQNIYLISAGGSLFRGKLYGKEQVSWAVMDDDRRYDGYVLECLDAENDKTRIFAAPDGIPSYTDNHGTTWKKPIGLPFTNSNKRNVFDFIKTSNQQLYIISKTDDQSNEYKIYLSSNVGISFKAIFTFYAESNRDFKLSIPHDSKNPLFVIQNKYSSKIYKINNDKINILFAPELPKFLTSRVNLTGCTYQGKTTLYCYTIESVRPPRTIIYKSNNGGYNWRKVSTFNKIPFKVGLYVLPKQPNTLILGGVECYLSKDGGQNFISKNDWKDYYKSPLHALHADMMYFNFIQNKAEKPFLLISNHGGIYISYDQLNTVTNIGTNNLNVSQYYSVKTNRDNPEYTFAGSQDQGIQRALKKSGKYQFEQLISGDFGNILFSDFNQRMWSIAPKGTIFYWHNPLSEKYPSHYILTDADERKVWIPQIIPSYNPNENAIFLARNDGKDAKINYSHIKKISYSEKSKGKLSATSFPFNFTQQSNGGELTTFNYHPKNSHQWIAGTSNGYIFYSNDYWRNFKKSRYINLENTDHFYIHKVLFSENEDEVYVVGSGYSNSPIMVSNDGGINFESMQRNLPPTTIFDIKMIEGLLFIAAENGPWVYFRDLDKWLTLTGFDGPLQSYRAIEYIETNGKKIVRFGTFGRGIWDFNIDRISATSLTNSKPNRITAFPNPAKDFIQFKTPPNNKGYNVSIYHINGTLINHTKLDFNSKLAISHLKKGTYIIHLSDKQLNFVSKIIKY